MALKAQSAMEYLTTYGWTILVVAVVILVLFKVGVFNNGSSVGSGSCIAVSGFQCTKPTLYSTGTLSATIGEIGQSITITGTGCSVNSTSPSVSSTLSNINLGSGQTAVLNFTCPVSNTRLGTIFTGTMWLRYNTGLQTGIVQAIGKIKVPVSTATSAPFTEIAKVPLTVMNLQSAATGANFQQIIYFNPSQSTAYTSNEASDLGNIRFYQSTTALSSWCESGCSSGSSNAVFWVNFPSGIAASSNVPVNMIFEPTTTEYDGVVAGEAPQLSVSGSSTATTHIAFTTAGSSTGADTLNTPTSGGSPTLWLCGDAEGYFSGGHASTSYSPPYSDGSADYATFVGNQNSNGCYATDQGQGPWSGVAIGVANGAIPYTVTTQSSSNACGGQCQSMSMPVSIPTTSFAVIIVTCGGDNQYGGNGACAAGGISGLPAGCYNRQDIGASASQSADLYTCNSISGSFTVSASSHQGTDIIDMAMAAYVFTNVTTVSTGYGQYDNGANVFNYYTNFLGSALPSSLGTVGAPTYTVSNGLQETVVDNSDFIDSISSFNSNTLISEFYGNQTNTGGNDRTFGVVTSQSGVASGLYFEGETATAQSYDDLLSGDSKYVFTGTTLGTHTKAVFSLWMQGTTAYGAYNYAPGTVTAGTMTTAYYQLGGSGSQTNYYQWLRRRSVPPNNIMPTVSFSSITK